jgi:hypothetical protein
MGSLAYLRTLCAGQEAQDWRERMAALIEAEAARRTRDRLTSAYNRGFRAYSATHRSLYRRQPGGLGTPRRRRRTPVARACRPLWRIGDS